MGETLHANQISVLMGNRLGNVSLISCYADDYQRPQNYNGSIGIINKSSPLFFFFFCQMPFNSSWLMDIFYWKKWDHMINSFDIHLSSIFLQGIHCEAVNPHQVNPIEASTNQKPSKEFSSDVCAMADKTKSLPLDVTVVLELNNIVIENRRDVTAHVSHQGIMYTYIYTYIYILNWNNYYWI